MKIIILVDSSPDIFKEMIQLVEDRPTLFIDTSDCNEVVEYEYLLNNINCFSRSENNVMIARFSGKDVIVEDLGGECPDMIVAVSDDRNSNYFTDDPVDMFVELLTIFEKGG